MQNEALEKELRGRLYDYESPVDPEMTWLGVQEHIKPRRKRPGAIWWWLSGLLLVGVISSLAWSGLADTHSINAENATELKELIPAQIPTTPPKAGAIKADNSKQEDQEVMATNGKSETAAPVQNSATVLPEVTPTTKSQAATAKQPRPANVRVEAEGPAATPTLPSKIPAPAAKARTLTVSRLPGYLPSPLPKTFYDPKTPPFSTLKDPACPVFTKRNKGAWTLGLTGGISRPVREILAPDPDNPDQRLRNLTVERPLNALSAQVLVGYETGNGFSLRTGLGIQRINSLAEYTIDTVITTITTGISEIIVNGPGDTTFITGLVERRTHTSGTSRYYNRLTTVDVPILLGKTFRAGKWRFGLEAGPVLNLRSSGNARYQLADGTFNSRADNAGLFRSRLTGLGWQGSLYTAFAIRPKLDLSLGLQGLRQQRSGFEVDGSATKTTYDTYGIQLGLKQRF